MLLQKNAKKRKPKKMQKEEFEQIFDRMCSVFSAGTNQIRKEEYWQALKNWEASELKDAWDRLRETAEKLPAIPVIFRERQLTRTEAQAHYETKTNERYASEKVTKAYLKEMMKDLLVMSKKGEVRISKVDDSLSLGECLAHGFLRYAQEHKE